MASILEENAEQFGVNATEGDYNEEIYAPVRLSNSTRRFNSAREMVRSEMDSYSFHTMSSQEEQARRMEIDRMEDEAFNRKIEQRAKAAAWNDKVLAQRHGSAMSEIMVDLDPTQPDYLAKVDKALTQFPLAKLDPQIGSLLESRQAVFEVAQKQREKLQADTQRQIERQEAREDNQQFQIDAARIAREEQLRTNIELKVADMSAEGQNAYKKLLAENKTPLEAFQSARIEDKGVVTLKDANMANRLVQNYDRQIAQARKAIDEINADLSTGEADKAARRSVHETTISNLTTDRELEAAVVDAYWDSKGGRPKPKDEPKPDRDTNKNVNTGSTATPKFDPAKLAAARKFVSENPNDPRSKEIADQLKKIELDGAL